MPQPEPNHSDALTSAAEIAKQAMAGGSEPHRRNVLAQYFVLVVALVLAVTLIAAGYAALGFVGMVLALAIYGVVLWRSPGGEPPAGSSIPARQVLWSRRVPILPLSEPLLGRLNRQLSLIRDAAHNEVINIHTMARQTSPWPKENPIRASVFLPDVRQSSKGDFLVLRIPDGLLGPWLTEEEKELRLRPWQGLTGRAFCQERALGGMAILEEGRPGTRLEFFALEDGQPAGRYDRHTEFSRDQLSRIPKSLRWILAIPLRYGQGASNATLGVVTVDYCGDVELKQDLLVHISTHILAPVSALANSLAETQTALFVVSQEAE